MPLTVEHDEKRVLSDEQVEQVVAASSFLEIMALDNVFIRAEVLDRLMNDGVRVKLKSAEEDIQFRIDRARGEPETFVIPGKGKAAKAFPARVAIYVAANRDYPLFGGSSWRAEKHADGMTTMVPVPARPNLISFELVREE